MKSLGNNPIPEGVQNVLLENSIGLFFFPDLRHPNAVVDLSLFSVKVGSEPKKM